MNQKDGYDNLNPHRGNSCCCSGSNNRNSRERNRQNPIFRLTNSPAIQNNMLLFDLHNRNKTKGNIFE